MANAVKHYKDLNLKESCVRDWRDAYLREVCLQRNTAKPGEKIIIISLSYSLRFYEMFGLTFAICQL